MFALLSKADIKSTPDVFAESHQQSAPAVRTIACNAISLAIWSHRL
jgi:hypothetical protein